MTLSSVEWTLDRIEGAVAVLVQAGAQLDVPLALLPEGVIEGSTILLTITPPDTQPLTDDLAALLRGDHLDSQGDP